MFSFEPSQVNARSVGTQQAVTGTASRIQISTIPGSGPQLRLSNSGAAGLYYGFGGSLDVATVNDSYLAPGATEYVNMPALRLTAGTIIDPYLCLIGVGATTINITKGFAA